MEVELKIQKFLIGAVCAFSLTSCTQTFEHAKSASWADMAGTLGGAALGGYAGAQFGGGFAQTLFTATGTLFGSGAGYMMSRRLGPLDLTLYENTVQTALNSDNNGKIHRWSNPNTGRSGIFRTITSYHRPDGSKCRQYRSSVVFDDGVASASGAACQQRNGRWLALNDSFR